jgi:uncharacterized flavoprotein (TIGR03862 family)
MNIQKNYSTSIKKYTVRSVVIIGGGPSGLMAAEMLIEAGFKVDLYEAMPSVGRKFLMAGKGGMNISNDEPYNTFLSRYTGQGNIMASVFEKFSSVDLRAWLQELGIDTFVGSSGRVFPLDMKAAPLLRKWLYRLRSSGVNLHVRHRWLGWNKDSDQQLLFDVEGKICEVNADNVILALGGASWPQLGSTGSWVSILANQGIKISPLQPSNCGFEVIWSEYFRTQYSGKPLKSVSISLENISEINTCHKGELIVTEYGLEGGVIYTLSAQIRDEIALKGFVMIYIDLIPNISKEVAIAKMGRLRGKQSIANHLRKQLGISGVKAGLIRESIDPSCFSNAELLCALIKSLPIKLSAIRPIAEAISTAGGVSFAEIDQNLMLINRPGVFCTGEMLDWEAPTGGYLLTACLALGRAVGLGLINSFEVKVDNKLK